jgi:dihydroflavonol-4-reductase
MAETVLVTGGTGFVAGWCIVELLQRGYDVRTTVRSLAKEPAARAGIASVAGATDRLTFFAADLTQDEGWDAAMAGCDFVLHVASPLGASGEQDLVTPAREGTLRVLRFATKAGVKRVVMTSAAAAARRRRTSAQVSDETVWAEHPIDPKFGPYRLSKILAERAAWDFMAGNPGATTFATILPGAVFGPLLTRDNLGSVQIIQRLLKGRMPGVPRLGFWVVDVRDLADLHIRAMTTPEAAGQRFLAAGEFQWMKDIASALRSGLGAQAGKVPTRTLPDFVVRLSSFLNPQLRSLLPDLGRKNPLTSEKARRVLGFSPRPAAATVIDCAKSVLAGNMAQAA